MDNTTIKYTTMFGKEIEINKDDFVKKWVGAFVDFSNLTVNKADFEQFEEMKKRIRAMAIKQFNYQAGKKGL